MFQSSNKAITVIVLLFACGDTQKAQSPGSGTSKPLPVCSILRDLKQYRNKLVTVRGELIRSDEGSYLSGSHCGPLIVDSREWPTNSTRLALTLPSSSTVEKPDRPAPKVRIESGAAALLDRYAANSDVCINVTIVGRLETKERFEMVLWGNGKLMPLGYGHLHLAPAQLVYTVIKDAEVHQCQTR